jgi:hypothetical protein
MFSSRKAVRDFDPLASTVEISARTAGRWLVRGLIRRTRSIVPSSGSRCPGPSVVSWTGTRLAAKAEMPMPAATAVMRPFTPRQTHVLRYGTWGAVQGSAHLGTRDAWRRIDGQRHWPGQVVSSCSRRPASGFSRRPRRSNRTWPCSWSCWARWASSTSRFSPWPTPPSSSPSIPSCAVASWACTCWPSSTVPHRRPGHRGAHEPLRCPGWHGHMRCRPVADGCRNGRGGPQGRRAGWPCAAWRPPTSSAG